MADTTATQSAQTPAIMPREFSDQKDSTSSSSPPSTPPPSYDDGIPSTNDIADGMMASILPLKILVVDDDITNRKVRAGSNWEVYR